LHYAFAAFAFSALLPALHAHADKEDNSFEMGEELFTAGAHKVSAQTEGLSASPTERRRTRKEEQKLTAVNSETSQRSNVHDSTAGSCRSTHTGFP
jgi:hypothetical protein